MRNLEALAIRLYRRVFGSPAAPAAAPAYLVLDGATAVAVAEASIAECATFGNSATAARLVWAQETHPLSPATCHLSPDSESARGALAAAIGQALSGRRAAVFLSGPELAGALDLLHNAAGRHLPLVIHLTNQVLAGSGTGSGSGHEALHLAGESGCVVLVAANAQEAVDLTLVAHRVAELGLVPVIVAQDAELTAHAPQDVALPGAELTARLLGAASDPIAAPTPAQEMLFGERRRRVPCWHDLDQPVLLGAGQGADTFALGAAAASLFFEEHLGALVDQSFAEFSRLSGRPYGRVAAYRMEGAQQVLLVQGAAAEAARAVADHQDGGHPLGVLALRCLRPAPAAELVAQVAGRRVVAVLERRDQPLAGEPPLLRELRAGLDRAAENRRNGGPAHPGYPALEERRRPRLCSVIYGSGGLPLRAADLLALAARLGGDKLPARLFLGLSFHAHTPDHPKRQVMLDRIRRAYPQLADAGLRGEAAGDLRPARALTLAVVHRDGDLAHPLAGDAGALLQRLGGGRTRVVADRLGDTWCRDRLLHAPDGPGWPGDDFALDALLLLPGPGRVAFDLCADLSAGATLLLAGAGDEAALWQSLGAANQAAVRRLGLKLFRLADAPTADEAGQAHLLGGLCAALGAGGQLAATRRKLAAAWETVLAVLPEARRQALAAAFAAGWDAVAALDWQGLPAAAPAPRRDDAPMAVRHLGGSAQTWESLPRFWDQVGVLHRFGQAARLTPDPYLATGSVPPLSATFRDLSDARGLLPCFAADTCSGCGECWSACPDSAIGVTAITPAALIDAGIRATRGDALRPLAARLAGRVAAMGRQGQFRGGAAGDLLRRAWDEVQEKSPLPPERLAGVTPALEALCGWAGELPLSVTEPLFHAGERARRDGGELLALVVNPDACKGCGLCVAACAEGALTAAAQDAERLAWARRQWRVWEAVPDTGSQTIERVAAAGGMGPMAALLLSRHCALAMVGGDLAEAGSGEKIALRLALAAAEYQQQPLLHQFAGELRAARERVHGLLREALADALPSDDLDALSAALRGAAPGGGLDSVRVERLIALLRGLDEQHQLVTAGRSGLGRARYGLAVAAGSVAEWAGAFPYNPFQAPVVVDATGDAGQMAAGLAGGQIGEALRAFALLRRAQGGEGALEWEDLTQEQRRVCAPVILVGSEAELGGRGLAQVMWLLDSSLPVKVLVTCELDLGLDGRAARVRARAGAADPRTDLGLMALAQRGAYVAQTSIGDGAHLRATLREALRFTGPALIRIHTPSPGRHGFATDATLERARAAVRCRAFPLFRYHPQGEGVFGARLDLSGNPDPTAPWADGEGSTPLHWAAGEARFAEHFTPLAADAPAPTEVLAWLALEAGTRAQRTPCVTLADGQPHRVSPALLERADDLAHAWRTLQELAGLVTPFTERVRRAAEERVADAHRAELAALRQDYEARLSTQDRGVRAHVADEIRTRLLVLTGYH